MPGWSVAVETDWGRLFHAYGVALDTPAHLRDLISADADARVQAIGHLLSAILHQGTLYPATPPVARVIAGILHEPMLREPLAGEGSALGSALDFLAEIASSLAFIGAIEPPSPPSEADLAELFRQFHAEDEEEDWGSAVIETLMAQAVLDLRAMAGEMLEAITPFLFDEAADIRRYAINAVSQWGAVAPDDASAGLAAGLIEQRLTVADGRDERAALVLALGLLGQDVSPWLDDADEAVSSCAALFVAEPRATARLIAALGDPAAVDGWFTHRPAYFDVHIRFHLLGELLARRVTIEEMLPAALALIAGATAMTADYEWGRILQLAFPEQVAAFKPGQRPPLPTRLTSAQHAVLEQLVANERLWDPRSGNASLARMQVGLSDNPEEVAKYCRRTAAI